jgi:hypothetical protein
MECNGADDSLVLLLTDVWRDLALYLTGAECHCQSLCHVFLYSFWDVGGGISWTDPDICRALVFEFTLAELCEFGT